MDKEEQLLKEYQNNRRKFEEQEDDIKKFQRQGQQIADETYSEIRFLLSDISEDDEVLNMARIELANLEEEFMMNIDKEKKKLLNRQEEEEQRYRKELKVLKEGE
ncbi:hypothetical protein CI088_11185 [Enterococcus plantarum]|uniref:Uncharacterized protein n=1 Tax=Enterococcus plantarum TaxID=1077675 RepID=A0A2W3ZDQ6_9ENTE|nr:hypothetical protein [Enterococcus plantarum]PZL72164.1 hypothetical protein CI088_11185 [Enterococcus plantarum]